MTGKTHPYTERKDLLELLLSAVDDDSKTHMSSQQLRDEITTIFMAGHETTAQTLSWVFYQIALYPDICEKVRKEIKQASYQGRVDIHLLSYTKSVIEETMRLYPPVWIIARKSMNDDVLGGYHVPGGSTLLLNVYGLHHDETVWEDAESFRPERFSSGHTHAPFSFLPFGGGQRLCIGSHFAMMVMLTVVSKLVNTFQFRVPPGFKPSIDPNITLRAKGGIKLMVSKVVSS